MQQIMVIDDHPMVVSAMADAIAARHPHYLVICASNANEMRRLLNHSSPSLAVLDLELSDADGINLIPELCSKGIPVVVFSATTDPLIIHHCARNGAIGFVRKSSSTNEFFSALAIGLSGGQYFPVMDMEVEPRTNTVVDTLTKQQRRILDLLICAKRNKIIAGMLNMSEGSLRNRVSEIFKIFEVSSRTELLLAVEKIGYKPRGMQSSD